MMKSWADHCSSDEDTDDNHSVESEQSLGEAFTEKVQVEEELPTEVGEPEQQNVRTYDFPDRPPFTAFVGNLSYDIQESSQLQQALADVVFDRLGQRVNVLGGRISYERNSKDSKQHRGFGYVELETLEEVSFIVTNPLQHLRSIRSSALL
jgi:RNA recognition motif-containing protein